jgi:hypothetical protein
VGRLGAGRSGGYRRSSLVAITESPNSGDADGPRSLDGPPGDRLLKFASGGPSRGVRSALGRSSDGPTQATLEAVAEEAVASVGTAAEAVAEAAAEGGAGDCLVGVRAGRGVAPPKRRGSATVLLSATGLGADMPVAAPVFLAPNEEGGR